MRIVELIREASRPLCIITTDEEKKRILKRMNAEGTIRPVRFLNKQDLYEKVFFRMEERALLESARFLGKKPSVVAPLLGHLRLIDEKEDYRRPFPKKLRDLKVHLLEKKAIRPFPRLDTFFKEFTPIAYGAWFDPLFPHALERLRPYGLRLIEKERPRESARRTILRRLTTLEEEIVEVATSIRKAHDDGTPLNKIAVLNAHRAYTPLIRRIFPQFGIPVENLSERPLFEQPSVQRFLAALSPGRSVRESFEKALEKAFSASPTPEEEHVKERLVTVLNGFVGTDHPLPVVKDALMHILKEKKATHKKLLDAVRIETFSTIDTEERPHAHVVGLHEGHFPALAEEDDILEARDKEEIGLPSTAEVNGLKKKEIRAVLSDLASIHLYVSSRSLEEQFSESHFLEELRADLDWEEEAPTPFEKRIYSETNDALHVKTLYDEYMTYGTEEMDLIKGLDAFREEFDTFDNRFTGIEAETLNKFLRFPLDISYTRLSDYFECPFRFYLDHVLSVDKVEKNQAMMLGSFIHDVLEEGLFDRTLDETLLEEKAKRHLSSAQDAREAYFIEKAKEAVKTAHKHLFAQFERTEFQVHESEASHTKTYGDPPKARLKGVIDRVLKDGADHVIVDYKSGNPTFDLALAVHGIKAQLLVYMLLFRETNPRTRFLGFYEQKTYLRPLNREEEKTHEDLTAEFFRFDGFTRADKEAVLRFDPRALDDSFIKGLRFNKDGDISKQAKTFAEEDLEHLLAHTEELVEEALESISRGEFSIRPKKEGRNIISCSYCVYADVCHKRPRDYETLSKEKPAAIFQSLKKERGDA